MTRVLILAMLVACGSDTAHPDAATHPIDALADVPPPLDVPPGPDLACLGQPGSTTAPDPIPLTGKVLTIDHYQTAPLAGASVTIVRRADAAVLASDVTGSNGTFATNVDSGGAPVDAYFTIAATGFVTTRIDPVVPLTGSEHPLMAVASEAEIERWYGDANTTHPAGTATLIAGAIDCDQNPLPDTTAVVSPAAGITYYDAAAQRWDPQLAASTNGFVLVTSPAPSVTLTATRGSTSLPPRVIDAPAGILTIARLPPQL